MKSTILFLLCGLILLAGCSTAAESVEPTAVVAAVEATATVAPPTATAPPPDVIAATVAPPPTATLPATDTPVADNDPSSAVVFGRTDDGAYFHGSPDAPVTLIDYSDFL